MTDRSDFQVDEPLEHGDEPLSNFSPNPTFASVVERRLGRRGVLRGGLAAAVTGLFGTSMLSGARLALAGEKGPQITFKAIPVAATDRIIVPEGYTARVLIPWGTPITGSMPAFALENTGAEQGMQIGMHHDGMHFFPIEGTSPDAGSSEDGLLVLNHEYIEPRFMHALSLIHI
jgi:secreted PhoX family phosphatase